MTARLHRGGVANVARRADRIERVALDKALERMRLGDRGMALNLLTEASRVIEGLRVAK